MADYPKVQAGERLTIQAGAWNKVIDLISIPQSTGGQPAGVSQLHNVILARNSTGEDVPRWGVMEITGVEINPHDSASHAKTFEAMPCVTGGMPSDKTGPDFVIAIEPIKANAIGRVAVSGTVQVMLTVGVGENFKFARPHASKNTLKADHVGDARILWKQSGEGDKWALIRIGADVPMRVGKISAPWQFGQCSTVTIWEGDADGVDCKPSESEPCETISDVVNLSFDVPADSFVLISRAPNGRWYLTEAGIEGSCRKTIGGEDITSWSGWNGAAEQVLGHDASGCLKWFDVEGCSPD